MVISIDRISIIDWIELISLLVTIHMVWPALSSWIRVGRPIWEKTDMKTAWFSWWNVTSWLALLCSAWYLLSCWHTDGPTETVSYTSWPVLVTCLGTKWDLQGDMRGACLSWRIHGHKLFTTFLSYNHFSILWLTLSFSSAIFSVSNPHSPLKSSYTHLNPKSSIYSTSQNLS